MSRSISTVSEHHTAISDGPPSDECLVRSGLVTERKKWGSDKKIITLQKNVMHP